MAKIQRPKRSYSAVIDSLKQVWRIEHVDEQDSIWRLGEAEHERRADAHARHLCWYLMHTCQGMRQSDIAAWFDVDRRAVAWGVSRVEDRRDDPDFDARLTAIEDKLAG